MAQVFGTHTPALRFGDPRVMALAGALFAASAPIARYPENNEPQAGASRGRVIVAGAWYAARGGAMARWRQTAESAERAWDDRRVADAVRLYEKAAAQAERADDTIMLAVILHNFGRALDQEGNGTRARNVLRG